MAKTQEYCTCCNPVLSSPVCVKSQTTNEHGRSRGAHPLLPGAGSAKAAAASSLQVQGSPRLWIFLPRCSKPCLQVISSPYLQQFSRNTHLGFSFPSPSTAQGPCRPGCSVFAAAFHRSEELSCVFLPPGLTTLQRFLSPCPPAEGGGPRPCPGVPAVVPLLHKAAQPGGDAGPAGLVGFTPAPGTSSRCAKRHRPLDSGSADD